MNDNQQNDVASPPEMSPLSEVTSYPEMTPHPEMTHQPGMTFLWYGFRWHYGYISTLAGVLKFVQLVSWFS